MKGARSLGRQPVNFDAAESAFFQLGFELYRCLTRDEKRKCMAQEGVMSDHEHMFSILKPSETRNEVVDIVFGSEFGEILEPVF